MEETLEDTHRLLHAREALGERADSEVAADGDVLGAQDDAEGFWRYVRVRRGHAQTRSNSK